MCCHQHPDNGSDLALQTQEQADYTDAQEKLDAVQEVREVIRTKNTTAWHIGELLDAILGSEKA